MHSLIEKAPGWGPDSEFLMSFTVMSGLEKTCSPYPDKTTKSLVFG